MKRLRTVDRFGLFVATALLALGAWLISKGSSSNLGQMRYGGGLGMVVVAHFDQTTRRVLKDETCHRIEWLTEERLTFVASDASGWDTLWIDKSDGRLWERLFLQSSMHGGGPPSLFAIDEEAARSKYHVTAEAWRREPPSDSATS